MSESRVWWFGTNDHYFPEFHEQTVAWVTSLGLDPNRIKPEAHVEEVDGCFEFHADEVVRDDERGGDKFDPDNPDQLLTVHRVVPVQRGSWPARPTEVNF